MTQPVWQFWLVDDSENTLADLSLARSKTLSVQRKGPASFQSILPITSAAAAAVPDGQSYVKGYRTVNGVKSLRFYGPVELDEIQGSDQSDALMVTAYDPSIWWGMRSTVAVYSSATARGTILKAIVDTTNTDDDTGILTSDSYLEATNTTTVDWTSDQPTILSVFEQFADALDGCDYEIIPQELSSGKIGQLWVYDQRGISNTGVVFGYGPGTVANCTEMRRTRNRLLMANDVIGTYGAGSTVEYTYPTGINTYRLREYLLNLTGEASATEAAQRTSGYLGLHQDANAVAEYSLRAGPSAPRLWDDFDVGDTVTVDFAKGVEFTVAQRVEGVTLNISDEGVEEYADVTLRGAT